MADALEFKDTQVNSESYYIAEINMIIVNKDDHIAFRKPFELNINNIKHFAGNFNGYLYNKNDIHICLESKFDNSFLNFLPEDDPVFETQLPNSFNTEESYFYFPVDNSMITVSIGRPKGLIHDRNKLIYHNVKILNRAKKNIKKNRKYSNFKKIDIPINSNVSTNDNEVIDFGMIDNKIIIVLKHIMYILYN